MTDMPTTYETKTTTQSSTSIGIHPEYIRTIPGILKIVEIGISLIVIICSSVYAGFAYLGGGWVQFVSIVALLCTLFLFFAYFTNFIIKLPGPWVLIALSLIVIICSSINWWFVHMYGGGWVQFVSIVAFICTILLLIGYLTKLIERVPHQTLIVLSILTFICSCVSYYPGQGWVQFVAMSAFVTTLVHFFLHLCNLISHFPGPYLLIEFIYYCVFSLFYLIAAIVAAAKGGWHPSIGATAFFAFCATAVYAVDTFFQFRAYRTGQTEMTTTTTTTTERNVEAAHQGPY